MGLTQMAIRRPVFIFMLMLAALILGFLSLRGMRTEQNPDVSFPSVTVSVSYPGAGPEEIETLVTRRIEDAVSSVSSVDSLISTSQEGTSFTTIAFKIGTPVDVAFEDVRTKIDGIRSLLPKNSLAPTVQKFDTTSQPVLYLSLASNTRASRDLRDLIDQRIKDRFSRIPGVGSIAVNGGDEREILVAVDQDRLVAYGIPITRVWSAINDATLNVPAGRSTEGNREYTVRVYGEFRSVDELRNLKIPLQNRDNPNAKGPTISLSNVATVTDTTKERTTYNRLNGVPSITLVFQKTSQGNAVEISKAAHVEIERLKSEYPDITFTVVTDTAEKVVESLTDLEVSLALGIILVIGIIFLFLHNIRGTIIVALAIPTCIFGTFMVMNAFGFTLNTMTMLGLSLAVGILVDDAIVVLENIYRHLTLGEDPKTAAINGRSEIGLAAIVITLVDIAVFIPISTMGGVSGQFFRSFGITVATATLLSLFVSFTVTPMLASRWYKAGEHLEAEEARGFFGMFERIWGGITNSYRSALAAALRHRWLTLFLGFGVLVSIFMMIGGSFVPSYAASVKQATGALKPMVGIAAVLGLVGVARRFRREWFRAGGLFLMWGAMFFVATVFGTFLGIQKGQPIFQFRFAPGTDQGQVSISMIFPAGTSLESTDREVKRVEKICAKTKDVERVLASVGSTTAGFFGAGDSGSQFAQIQVTLYPKRSLGEALTGAPTKGLRLRKDSDVADEIRASLGRIPDCILTVSAVSGFGFGAPISISLSGRDNRQLADSAAKVRDMLTKIPGCVDADVSSKPGKPEIRAYADRDRMADANVSVQQLGAALRISYEGDDSIKYRENGQEYPIRVRLEEQDRNNVDNAKNVPVAFASNGGLLTLQDLAKPRLEFGATKINRRDKQREILVTSQLLPGYNPGNMQQVIDKKLDSLGLPEPGITKTWQGENKVQGDEAPFLFRALILGLILVYMLMASLFDNILYPLVIQFAQPQAMAGALLALIIAKTTFDIVGFIGVIMLVGLVGKNAILLVDYTNTLRSRGMDRQEALLTAGPIRLRPIAMTTLALIFAMIPVALAIGRGSEFRAPLGVTVIGGLTLSTFLTLLVIPCTYTVMDDLSNWIGRLRRRGPV